MTKHDVDLHIGRQIKARRLFMGLTQQKLAEGVGYGKTQIVNIETGRNGTTHKSLWELCNVLHCSPSDLFPPIQRVKTEAK